MKRLLSLVLLCAMAAALTPAMAEDTAYRTLYSSEVTTLNYLITTTTSEYAVAANVIDTLVEYDRYGQIQPSLAESWERSDDGLTWPFTCARRQWVNGAAEEIAVTATFVASISTSSTRRMPPAPPTFCTAWWRAAYYAGTATPEEGATWRPSPRGTRWALRRWMTIFCSIPEQPAPSCP